jgi:hypothetical protein
MHLKTLCNQAQYPNAFIHESFQALQLDIPCKIVDNVKVNAIESLIKSHEPVIPAKAGIQFRDELTYCETLGFPPSRE